MAINNRPEDNIVRPPPGYYSRERLYGQLPWYPGLASMCPNRPEYAGITLYHDGSVAIDFTKEADPGDTIPVCEAEAEADAAVLEPVSDSIDADVLEVVEASIEQVHPDILDTAFAFESAIAVADAPPEQTKPKRSELVELYRAKFGKAPQGLRAAAIAKKLGISYDD